jgi:lipopolysaccharide/colanic/teichoic acid biosynthesis glycosyltransferase
MTPGKRLMDIILAILLMALLAFPALIITAILLLREGRPVLYRSERMQGPTRAFMLWKFRTMTVAGTDAGVSGGDKALRITPTGWFLRRSRLDEIPQLWNVLRGDISFVGPRPPLRQYVEKFPDLYARVLQSRPGITGLATVTFHRHEERLLARCRSPEETNFVYERRCIPRKARLDLIYQSRRNLCLDLQLIARTAAKVFPKR